MNTKITLHDYVQSAVDQALNPFDGAEIVASKCVNSISDFEHDCSKSEHQYSMVVCRLSYSWKHKDINRYKLEIQTEDWVNFFTILFGYEVKRYVAVLTPLDSTNPTENADCCIKIVTSVYRDDSPLDVSTLINDIKRVLTRHGIILEDDIVLGHNHFDKVCDTITRESSSTTVSELKSETDNDRIAFFKELKQKMIMEIAG